MEINERILTIIKEKGPILPVQASKVIKETILMTSARLSELLTDKKIKISNLKIGGSPLYYFQGQEGKLQNFSDNLIGMEKKAYDLLYQHKILRDSNQEPAVRVALSQIKDFAVPLQVNYENNIEIFWKWYLIDKKEAELLIRGQLLSKKEIKPEKTIEKPTQRVSEEKLLETPKEESIEQIKKIIDKNSFLKEVHNFFNKNNIYITETQNIKKGSEIDFLIKIQTSIGNLKYFCKAKNKKKISDADLSSAVIQAQSKNLQLLFLTNGILTKKSQDMLNNELKNITFKQI